jgi:hypothetical protein
MSNPSIESFIARGLALKKEATEGVDASPTAPLNAFQILDGQSKIQADEIKRNLDRPYFNSARSKYATFRAQITGNIELVPPEAPGVDSMATGLALEIAGMAKTLTAPDAGPPVVKGSTLYTPISRLIPSATGYWWHAGTFKKLLGARANLTGISHEIGKYLMAAMTLEGSCDDITEDDLPDDFDYDLFLEPTVGTTESMELKINDFAVNGLSHSVDIGSQIKTREHTEARRTSIGSKQSTFKARFYRTALADFNPMSKWKSGEIIEVKSMIVTAAGTASIVTSLGQVTGLDETNIDDEYGWEISGNLVAVSGNDELLVNFAEA